MTETTTKAGDEAKVYERCVQCSAPVDADQRYCVACGARNQRARDPVARYLALATSRARAGRAETSSATPRRRGAGLATAAVIAAIPLAVAVGVLVGRSESSNDSKLIAALRAQKPPVVNVTGTGTAASTAQGTASAATTVASTFSLASGFAVELSTIPASGASQSAVTAAERAATAKGATAVGVIAAHDLDVTPKPAAGSYVLYSGQYRTRSAAVAALAQLKRRFPRALVIAVQSTAAASAGGASANQVTPTNTKQSLAAGANDVKKISHVTGSGYVQAQNNLPGVVSVP